MYQKKLVLLDNRISIQFLIHYNLNNLNSMQQMIKSNNLYKYLKILIDNWLVIHKDDHYYFYIFSNILYYLYIFIWWSRIKKLFNLIYFSFKWFIWIKILYYIKFYFKYKYFQTYIIKNFYLQYWYFHNKNRFYL